MRTVFGPTVLDGFGQFGNGAVQFTVGAPVLRLLLRQFIFDVEQHGLDDVELIGHLRFHVVQSILDFPWQSKPAKYLSTKFDPWILLKLKTAFQECITLPIFNEFQVNLNNLKFKYCFLIDLT